MISKPQYNTIRLSDTDTTIPAVDVVYEHAQKRTYLVMLIQVGLFLPLLIGLFLFYPWLAGSRKIDYSHENQDKQGRVEGGEEEEVTDETTGLMPKTL